MAGWLIVAISFIGITIPTFLALVASWYDIQSRQIRLVARAPRRRQPITVVLYHTDIIGTRESITALRRITSLRPEIIIVVPAEHAQQVASLHRSIRFDTRTHLHIKRHASSRAVAIASCYPLLVPTHSVLVIDSGDIVPAATIHSAQRLLRDRPSLTALLIERTRQVEPTLPSVIIMFGLLSGHVGRALRAAFHLPLVATLPAGTLLRAGYQLRTSTPEHSCYSRVAPILQKSAPQFPYLHSWNNLFGIVALFVIGYAYYLAANLQTVQPILLVWIICAWLAISALSTYRPQRPTDLLFLLSIVPLMGIIAPAIVLILITSTTVHTVRLLLRQSLAWTRREHAIHRVFFGARHP